MRSKDRDFLQAGTLADKEEIGEDFNTLFQASDLQRDKEILLAYQLLQCSTGWHNGKLNINELNERKCSNKKVIN